MQPTLAHHLIDGPWPNANREGHPDPGEGTAGKLAPNEWTGSDGRCHSHTQTNPPMSSTFVRRLVRHATAADQPIVVVDGAHVLTFNDRADRLFDRAGIQLRAVLLEDVRKLTQALAVVPIPNEQRAELFAALRCAPAEGA